MSRNYQNHPELYPSVTANDPYYFFTKATPTQINNTMTYTIERWTQGTWVPVSHHNSRELAETEIGIQRSLRLNGQPLYPHLRIRQSS